MVILTWQKLAPWGLLLISNVFMTSPVTWRLRFKDVPILKVILISWLIAGAEYMFAVPANRIGSAVYSAAQLKTMQEAITLVVFAGFSLLYLGEPLRLTTLAGFALIFCGAALVFLGRS
jgi:uncharacterized protein (DUF486 family)